VHSLHRGAADGEHPRYSDKVTPFEFPLPRVDAYQSEVLSDFMASADAGFAELGLYGLVVDILPNDGVDIVGRDGCQYQEQEARVGLQGVLEG
jgi:hypothetical protein